jgi:hypothetical protein
LLSSECPKPEDPTNGQFQCNSSNFAQGSACYLQCDPGYIIAQESVLFCQSNSTWDKPMYNFVCSALISLVIGGIDDNQE